MSIFGKKSEPKSPQQEQQEEATQELDLDPDESGARTASSSHYGIADAMLLMRSLPLEQNLDLVVRVVRVTLSSVNVRIEDIVEDATRRQKDIQDNIASLHEKVAELEEELEARRREISAQEADFKETTSVKERLLLAEKSGNMSAGHRGAGGQNYAPSLDLPQSPSTQPPPPPSRVLPKPAPRE